jgi:hypothetical protein
MPLCFPPLQQTGWESLQLHNSLLCFANRTAASSGSVARLDVVIGCFFTALTCPVNYRNTCALCSQLPTGHMSVLSLLDMHNGRFFCRSACFISITAWQVSIESSIGDPKFKLYGEFNFCSYLPVAARTVHAARTDLIMCYQARSVCPSSRIRGELLHR